MFCTLSTGPDVREAWQSGIFSGKGPRLTSGLAVLLLTDLLSELLNLRDNEHDIGSAAVHGRIVPCSSKFETA